jgi:hypothetical protein
MESTEVKGVVNASAGSVWGIISPFVGIEKFVPAIEKSACNGEGEGMERTCTLGNGASFDETLLILDHQNMELQYNVHDPSPFPFSGYVSTMKVTPMESDKCEVSWSCTYQVDSGTVEETHNMLQGLFQSGIEGLGKLTS